MFVDVPLYSFFTPISTLWPPVRHNPIIKTDATVSLALVGNTIRASREYGRVEVRVTGVGKDNCE